MKLFKILIGLEELKKYFVCTHTSTLDDWKIKTFDFFFLGKNKINKMIFI